MISFANFALATAGHNHRSAVSAIHIIDRNKNLELPPVDAIDVEPLETCHRIVRHDHLKIDGPDNWNLSEVKACHLNERTMQCEILKRGKRSQVCLPLAVVRFVQIEKQIGVGGVIQSTFRVERTKLFVMGFWRSE